MVMERRDSTLALRGLNFHLIEWGPVDAPPIVMLHGIRGYANTFEVVAEALQPRFRLIAYDQRGRGQTDWDPQHDYYTDVYVADLHGVANALALARFDLLGHSMGGFNAIAYAVQYPDRVRRLVIEDAGVGAFENSAGASRIKGELANTPTHFATWDEATEYIRALRPTVTENARQDRLRNMLKPAAGGGFTWCHDHQGIARARIDPDPKRLLDFHPLVAQIRCPTLLVRGGESDYLQPQMVEYMTAANPLITATEIPGAGHYVHDDQPALFNAAVKAFLPEPHL